MSCASDKNVSIYRPCLSRACIPLTERAIIGNMMRGQMFWYYFARVGGIPVADGPFLTENLAYTKASALTDVDEFPTIKSYRTRTLAEAKAAWRSEQAEKTGELGPVLQPIRSTTTALKWKQKKDERSQRLDELKEERGIS